MLSIIVVTTNNREEKLQNCLASITANKFPTDQYEVIVVYSGPKVRPLGNQGLTFKRLDLVLINPQQGNIGAAKARNIGINKAQGRYIFFTDDDCIVPPNWLETTLTGYREHPEVAGAGGMTLPPEESIRSNVWAWWEAEMYLKLLPGKNRVRPLEEASLRLKDRISLNGPRKERGRRQIRSAAEGLALGRQNGVGPYASYLSATRDEHPAYTGNISYKKAVLEEVGGFNENFPPTVYGEDGDLKERVLAAGYQLLFVPTVVRHHDNYDFRTFWYKNQCRGRGIMYYNKKHSCRRQSKPEILLRLLAAPVAFLMYLGKNRNLKFAGLETLAYAARQIGKLKPYHFPLAPPPPKPPPPKPPKLLPPPDEPPEENPPPLDHQEVDSPFFFRTL